MIPLQLLRVKISNKGKNIAPIFCTSDEDVSLAANIIGEFEESSKSDFALTILRREEIIQSVARQLGVDRENVLNQMWGDLDENLVVENFDRITPAILVAWYNLAIIQTLLFSCTTLQVALHGGSSWKRVLRDVKRVGLMYNIRNQPSTLADRTLSLIHI